MTQQKGQNQNLIDNGLGDNGDNKKKRRKKGDDSVRKHICKICLKTYLSYPALYTHTKSKHEKTPGKITQSDVWKNNRNIEPILFINQIVKLLRDDKSSSPAQEYRLEDVLEPFEQKNELQDSIAFWEEDTQQQMNQDSQCFKTTIDQVIIKLLNNLINKVEIERLQELCIVVLIWRQSINKEWKNYSITGTYECYSKQADSQFLLKSVNDLVLTYFPLKSGQYLSKIQQINILRGQALQLNLCKLILSISKWLYAQKYTKDKLKYNESD